MHYSKEERYLVLFGEFRPSGIITFGKGIRIDEVREYPRYFIVENSNGLEYALYKDDMDKKFAEQIRLYDGV